MRLLKQRARSQGHPQSRQGVRMSAARASEVAASARSRSRPCSSPAAGTSTRNIATAERAGARGGEARRADHPASRSCSRRRISASSRIRATCASPPASPTTAPSGISRRSRASSASCCRSASSRRPNNSYLQFDRHPRCGWQQSRRVSQVAHSERPGLPGEELLQPRRHRLQGLGHALRAHRRGHLLGPVVSGDARAPWRCMGAELLFYPTAIGSEPPPALPVNSRDHWQRTQQGHAAANLTPVIVSNRIGTERALQNPDRLYIRFYGSSFIADATGAKIAEAGEEQRGGAHREVRSGRDRASCATTGSCSATGGRICTAP